MTSLRAQIPTNIAQAATLSKRIGPNPAPVVEPAIRCQLGDPFAQDGSVHAEVGWLSIQGELDRRQYQEIIRAAESMLEAGVQRVGLTVNSQGGALPGLDGAVRALLELRAATDGQYWSFAPEQATSAGYTLLATAPRGNVFASMASTIGALGATVRIEDSSRFYRDELLVDVHQLVGDRTLKPTGVPGVPVTREQLAFQERQRSSGDQGFIALTAAARGISTSALERMADKGGAYEAAEALRIGLIDRVLDEPAFQAIVAAGSQPEDSIMPSPSIPGQPAQTAGPVQTTTTPAPAVDPVAPAQVAAAAPLVPTTTVPAQPAPAPVQAPAPTPAPASAADPTGTQEQIAALTANVAQLTAAVAGGFGAIQAQNQATKLAALNERIEACHDRSTPASRETTKQMVKTAIDMGIDPESIVAGLEAATPIQDQADLTAEVTFQPYGVEQPMKSELNLAMFTSPGADGKAKLPPATKARAIEVLQAVGNAPEGPGQRMAALEALYAKTGFLGGALQRIL